MTAIRKATQTHTLGQPGIPMKEYVRSDAEIWKSFKKGNDEAFIKIYEQYFEILYTYGYQFTRDKGLIEDSVQDLFIYIRKNRASLSDTSSIKFYLFKALRNRLIRSIERQKKIVPSELNEAFDFQVNISFETKLIKAQIDEQAKLSLLRAFEKLSPRQREIIIYYYYEELSYEQIADLMDLSKVKYARDLLYRAIDSLRADEILKSLRS
ncbi:MAG: sigma-70 family RNA polymerase sigma factor [Cyclobacteriaceae bacterium]